MKYLVFGYFDCRRTKRNTASAQAFEANLEGNIRALHRALVDGTYQPGPSICFVNTRPKYREVWASPFADRVPHHALYNRIGPAIEATFTADSCACIRGRGTLYGAKRLEAKIRSLTQNWSRPGRYLKLDIANFFVSIHKPTLAAELERRIEHPWWRDLALQILWHDPRIGAIYQSSARLMKRVPPHKRLAEAPADRGLPIGNLSSQFFANVYLDVLDQFVKHVLRVKHYIRYVDDMILLHEDPAQLNAWHDAIEAFLPERLGLQLNPAKTVRQPIPRGVDFVGQVIKPWRRHTRLTTLHGALHRLERMDVDDVFESANSTFGLLRQVSAGHGERAQLANLLRARGFSVNRELTKTYRRSER